MTFRVMENPGQLWFSERHYSAAISRGIKVLLCDRTYHFTDVSVFKHLRELKPSLANPHWASQRNLHPALSKSNLFLFVCLSAKENLNI